MSSALEDKENVRHTGTAGSDLVEGSSAPDQVKFPSTATGHSQDEEVSRFDTPRRLVSQPTPSPSSSASFSSPGAAGSTDTTATTTTTPSLKQKRSTVFHGSEAFKAKTNQKPFSSSAAKRESVMALGSIGHLQNFYAKQGFAARQPNARLGGRLALGPGALGASSASPSQGNAADALAALEGRATPPNPAQLDVLADAGAEEEDESGVPAPPITGSTWKGRLPSDMPKPVEADLSRLWSGMIEALDDTCQVWDLFSQIKSTTLPKSRNPSQMNEAFADAPTTSGLPVDITRNPLLLDATVDSTAKRLSQVSIGSQGPAAANTPVDLLETINGTTKTIRAVRNYLFALPPLPRLTRQEAAGVAMSGAGESAATDHAVESLQVPTTPSSSSKLRKKPSLQFINGEEHLPGVKARDAFKRSSNSLKSERRRSFIGSSGFAADVADGTSARNGKMTGAGSSGPGPSAATPRPSHAPSSFVPFETVQQRRRSSIALDDGDGEAERESLRRSLGLDRPEAATIGKGLPSGATTPVAALAASERAGARGQSPQRSATAPAPASMTATAKQDDPLVVVRSSALEVLGMLRALEESSRVDKQDGDGEGDDHGDEGDAVDDLPNMPTSNARRGPRLRTTSVRMMRDYSEGGSTGDASTSASGTTSSTMRIPKEDADEEVEGYLYRQDLTLGSLEKQREIVSKYLATVDQVLAAVSKVSELRKYMRGAADTAATAQTNGIETILRQPSQASEDDTADDSRLPVWARKSYNGDGLDRIRTMILDVLPDLPAEMLDDEPLSSQSPPPTSPLLRTLSDGQILCHAYNAALRRSGRPWGFIQSSAIHDVKGEEEAFRARLAEEEAAAVEQPAERRDTTKSRRPQGWTFRRIENLKRFSAAVALRYGIKTSSSTSGTSAPSTGSHISHGQLIAFDPTQVARMDTGWEDMLRNLVMKWFDVVVEEERGS